MNRRLRRLPAWGLALLIATWGAPWAPAQGGAGEPPLQDLATYPQGELDFWMKNTYIPLDMLFIDARGRIVAIFANTTPHSLDPVGPDVPVKAILELRGGEAARRGIRAGDRVLHSAFR